MISSLTTKELARFAYVARSLWHRRNAFLYERHFAHPTKLFEKAVTECHLYQQAIQALVHKPNPVASLVVRWELPPADFIKFNWDITVQQTTNRIGIGIVLRDCGGEVLLSLMKPLVLCSNAAYAEARGLFEVVKLCSKLGFTNCMFEGDSLHVVQAINTQGSEEFIHNPIIADIKQLMHGTNWSLQHVKRAANQVAHKLAKEALFLNEERLEY
ncbi:uncharacterized protein LOC122301084 [Carya illinoinensis]|uniref:uncharacterized protein LOC122301084 n=1 Tax=Carya illinoinensis TaxID=32201 RepID=UPI001C717D5E|nr:uncharacterized protein LOC122301084 [Carya illinoinensis]